jgi:hypothetical protein
MPATLGALRWTLAQLRRAVGVPDVLRGDRPVRNIGTKSSAND